MTTLVTAAQIADVRRMVAEPGITVYTDVLLTTIIERYPLLDVLGEEPFEWTPGVPPTATANPEWIPTYDLHAAAADVWEEKAGGKVLEHDFSADGGNYARSQMYDMCMKQVRHHRARRAPTTARGFKWPEEPSVTFDSGIINNPEPID